jgi:ribosomal protein L40E
MTNQKSIQDLMLAGEETDEAVLESQFASIYENFEVCPRCGVENDEEAESCWNCGSSMVLPTLADCGRKLPIGVLIEDDDGKGASLNKRFDLIPLSWPIERAIGRYWQKRREHLSISEYVGVILAFTASQIGDKDMTKLKVVERLEFLNQLFMGDVFYMYAYLRLISMGNELIIKGLQCIADECRHRFNYTADVSSLSVIKFDSIQEIEQTITLPDGFEYASDVRTKLVVRPPLWNVMGDPNFALSEQDSFESTIISSVVQIDDLPRGAILTPKDFDAFTKTDIEFLKEQSEMILAGPRWTVEGVCPKCQEQFFFELDWTFESFFGRSFVSRRRRKRSKK